MQGLYSPIIDFFFVSCFDIGEVPRSPWKWNWNLFYFLPSILTFEQCGSTSKCNSKSPHKNCEAILKVIFRRLNITYSLHGRAIRQPFNLHPDFRESRSWEIKPSIYLHWDFRNFWHSPVWNIQFDELDFFLVWKQTGYFYWGFFQVSGLG